MTLFVTKVPLPRGEGIEERGLSVCEFILQLNPLTLPSPHRGEEKADK
jgi:hypothetical protein